MGFLSNARIALCAMLRRPLRTFLVLQGVVWAVAIIVFPSAIKKGAINNALRNASRFKTDEITVRASGRAGTEALTLSDAAAVKAALAGKRCSVTPFRTRSGEVFVGPRVIRTTIVGTDETSPSTRMFRPSLGRYLTAGDLKEEGHVCVLEALAAEELFRKRSPLGRGVRVRCADRLLSLRVVGVMERRETEQLATDEHGFRKDYTGQRFRGRWLTEVIRRVKSMLGIPAEDTGWKRTERCVHLPLSLLPSQDDSIDWLIVRTNPLEVLDTARVVQRVLVERNKEPVLLYNIFLPMLLSDQLKVQDDLALALFLLCLIMGGIMVTNIMLVSVRDRSREIAIRRVEGASKGDIVGQFLTEGLVLCVTGAVFGVPLGLGLAYVVSVFEPYAISGVGLPLKDVLVAFGCAIFLGGVSAILPAVNAAKLDPVVLLQRE